MRQECNFDGLVGPTHHYAGLGVGNLASQTHVGRSSSPRRAALQGLDKMRLLAEWGIPQAILPPPPRPALGWLRELGFTGRTDWELIRQVADTEPELLTAAYSASAMWAANAATFAASCDTADRRARLMIANLTSSIHRAIEPSATRQTFERWLPVASGRFEVTGPLPAGATWRDEGAANQMWLSRADGSAGLHVFVYGDGAPPSSGGASGVRFPARQSRAASAAVARCLRLPPEATVFVAQHPDAIDAGVFHNDVIATSSGELLLCHERAFADGERSLAAIADRFQQRCGEPLRIRVVRERELSLSDAVESYLFNSQLIAPPARQSGQPHWLVSPMQCRELPAARQVVERLQAEGLIDRVAFVELRESMQNGGGPACLRLRLPLTPDEQTAVPRNAWYSPAVDDRLRAVIERHYPNELTVAELASRERLEQAQAAQQAVSRAIGLADDR